MNAGKVRRLKMGSLVSIDKDYPVYKGLNLIGRNKEATIILKETEISHYHAIITIVDEHNQYISDFGSCNGVFVDNSRLNPLELCKIHDGMLIKISTIDFTYVKDYHNLEETVDQRNVQTHESVYSAATQFINESALGKTQDQIPDDGFDFSSIDTQTIEYNIIPTQKVNEIKIASSKTDGVEASTSAEISIVKTVARNDTDKFETEDVRAKNINALEELSEDSFDFSTQMINASTELTDGSKKNEISQSATTDMSGDRISNRSSSTKESEISVNNVENDYEMGPITQAMDEELDRMEKFSEMCTQILPVRNNDSIHEAQTQIIDCSESIKQDENSIIGNMNINEAATQIVLVKNQGNEDENSKNQEEEFDSDGQSQLHLSLLTKKCAKTTLDTQDYDEDVINSEAIEEQVLQEMNNSEGRNQSANCVLNAQNQNNEELDDSVHEKIDSDRGDDSGSDTDVEGNINANSKFINSMTDVDESFIDKRQSYLDSTDSIIPETQDCNDSFKAIASTSRVERLSNFTNIITSSQEYSSEDLSLRITSSASSSEEKKLTTIEEKSEIQDDEDVIESDDEMTFSTSIRVTSRQDNHIEVGDSQHSREFAAPAEVTCEQTTDDDCDTEQFDMTASTQKVILESNVDKISDVVEERADSNTEFDIDCATQKVDDSSSSMWKKELANNVDQVESCIVKTQTGHNEDTINGDQGASADNDVDFNCPTQRIDEDNSTSSIQKNHLKDNSEMDTNTFFAAQTQKMGGASEDDVCDTDNFDFGAPTQKVESQSKSESEEGTDPLFLLATQKIVNSPKNVEVVDDFDFVAPTQPFVFKRNHKKQVANDEIDFDAPTQKIDNIPKPNESSDAGSSCDYDLPTQKVCNTVEASIPDHDEKHIDNISDDDDIDYMAPTQKVCNTVEATRPEPDDVSDDDDFDCMAPTQKVCNTVEATIPNPDVGSSDDDIDCMAPTQKVCNTVETTMPNRDDKSVDGSSDNDFDYMAPTQKASSNTKNEHKSKDKVYFQMDTDFNTPTQDISSNTIQINELLETQHPEDVPVINEPRVESQLEVMFDTETIHYQESAGCRPSNPMASVLIQSTTQDVLGVLDGDSQNNKTPGKRMSNSELDCEKPTKKPKEDICNVVRSSEKDESTDNNENAVTDNYEDLNKVNEQKKNTEQTSGESSCNETNSSWPKKYSRLSTKRNVKNLSDEELINDNNDLMDMDLTHINTNEANKNTDDNVSILIEDSNDEEIIALDDKSNDKQENNDEDDNDNINKSARKLRRKTHALVDDDLESQHLDATAPTTSIDNKIQKRTLRTRKPSDSKPSSSLYIVNLDNPDVSDFVETKVKMTKRRKSQSNDILKNLDSVIMDGKRKRRGAPRKIANIQEVSSDEDDGKITFIVPKKQPHLKISDTEDGDTLGEVTLSKPKVLLKRGRKPKKEKESGESSHEASDLNISVASRAKRIIKHKVCFTLCDDPGLTTLIRTLGGTVIDEVEKCTVVVTKQLQRTMKSLMAIGLKIPICSPKWLNDSKSKGSFLDPWDYLIVDEEAETKWNFSLKESFNRSNSVKLFSGYFFQLQVTQSLDVLKGAIQGSGGKVVSRMPKAGNFVVVSAPENKKKFEKYLKQDVMVVSTESIFDGVLRQEVVFNKYLLN